MDNPGRNLHFYDMSAEAPALAPRAFSNEVCWLRAAGHFFGDWDYVPEPLTSLRYWDGVVCVIFRKSSVK